MKRLTSLSVPVQVRFSPEQVRAIKKAAKAAKVPYTAFIREAAERATTQALIQPFISSLEKKALR